VLNQRRYVFGLLISYCLVEDVKEVLFCPHIFLVFMCCSVFAIDVFGQLFLIHFWCIFSSVQFILIKIALAFGNQAVVVHSQISIVPVVIEAVMFTGRCL